MSLSRDSQELHDQDPEQIVDHLALSLKLQEQQFSQDVGTPIEGRNLQMSYLRRDASNYQESADDGEVSRSDRYHEVQLAQNLDRVMEAPTTDAALFTPDRQNFDDEEYTGQYRNGSSHQKHDSSRKLIYGGTAGKGQDVSNSSLSQTRHQEFPDARIVRQGGAKRLTFQQDIELQRVQEDQRDSESENATVVRWPRPPSRTQASPFEQQDYFSGEHLKPRMKTGRSQAQARTSNLSESTQQDIAPPSGASSRRSTAMQRQKAKHLKMEQVKHRNLLDEIKMKNREMDDKKNRFSWTSYSMLTQTVVQVLVLFGIFIVVQIHLINQASRHYRVLLAEYAIQSMHNTGLQQKEEKIDHMATKLEQSFEIQRQLVEKTSFVFSDLLMETTFDPHPRDYDEYAKENKMKSQTWRKNEYAISNDPTREFFYEDMVFHMSQPQLDQNAKLKTNAKKVYSMRQFVEDSLPINGFERSNDSVLAYDQFYIQVDDGFKGQDRDLVMSYPSVFNEELQSLAEYEQREHSLGKFNEKSCGASFNLLEKDLNTTTKSTISFGVPLTAYQTADAEPIAFSNRQRIGQIIWEMDRDKNFDKIYKTVAPKKKSRGFGPRITAAYYPVQNYGDGLIGKIPDPALFNEGFGQVISEANRDGSIADELQAETFFYQGIMDFQRYVANQTQSSLDLFNCKGISTDETADGSLQKLIDGFCRYQNFLVDNFSSEQPQFRRMLEQTAASQAPPTEEEFLKENEVEETTHEQDIKEKVPWYSMFTALFAGSDYLQDFDELKSIEKGQYFVMLKSLRGEKRDPAGNIDPNTCPSLKTIGTDGNEKHAPSDFLFRNRDTSTLNVVFINEYDMEKDQSVYAFFVRKFIYEKVIFWYWIPISCGQIGLTAIIVLFTIWFINEQVLKPIQEMSQMTQFILNPENNKKQGQIFQHLVEKVKMIERRYSQMEQQRLGGHRRKESALGSKMPEKEPTSPAEGTEAQAQSDRALTSEKESIRNQRRDSLKVKFSQHVRKLKTVTVSNLQNESDINEVESLLFVFARFFLQTSSNMKRSIHETYNRRKGKRIVNYMDHAEDHESMNQLHYMYQMDYQENQRSVVDLLLQECEYERFAQRQTDLKEQELRQMIRQYIKRHENHHFLQDGEMQNLRASFHLGSNKGPAQILQLPKEMDNAKTWNLKSKKRPTAAAAEHFRRNQDNQSELMLMERGLQNIVDTYKRSSAQNPGLRNREAVKSEINQLLKIHEQSKSKLSSASLSSRASADSIQEDSQDLNETNMSHINETFQERQLPLDVRDSELRSDRKAEDAKRSFFANIRAKLTGRPKPHDETIGRISKMSNIRPSQPKGEKNSFIGSVLRAASPPQVSRHDDDMDFPVKETDSEDDRENVGMATGRSGTSARRKSALHTLDIRSPQSSTPNSEVPRPISTSNMLADLRNSLGSKSKQERGSIKILNRQADASLQSVHETEHEIGGPASSYDYSKDEIMI